MNLRRRSAIACALLLLAPLALSQCELVVNLDVEEVEAGPPDGCAICTALEDAGEDGGATDGAILDGAAGLESGARDTGATDGSLADAEGGSP